MSNLLLYLLIWVKFKHLIADYFLQGKYMLGKFKTKGWILPLAAHAGVQALFTLGMTLFFTSPVNALGLAVLDFTIHFLMDRAKASPDLLGRFSALSKGEFKGILENRAMYTQAIVDLGKYVERYGYEGKSKEIVDDTVKDAQAAIDAIDKRIRENTYFWWSLGVDQTVHAITDIIIIYLMLK